MQFLDVFFLSCGAFFRPNEKLDNKSDETGVETGPNTLSYLDDGNSRADHFKNLEGSRTEGHRNFISKNFNYRFSYIRI